MVGGEALLGSVDCGPVHSRVRQLQASSVRPSIVLTHSQTNDTPSDHHRTHRWSSSPLLSRTPTTTCCSLLSGRRFFSEAVFRAFFGREDLQRPGYSGPPITHRRTTQSSGKLPLPHVTASTLEELFAELSYVRAIRPPPYLLLLPPRHSSGGLDHFISHEEVPSLAAKLTHLHSAACRRPSPCADGRHTRGVRDTSSIRVLHRYPGEPISSALSHDVVVGGRHGWLTTLSWEQQLSLLALMLIPEAVKILEHLFVDF